MLRSLGLGLITGAADDDCSAIGTYAQAGAQLGYQVLWTAPVTFPMMVAVVYLSGKLGQVTGQGLFSVLRLHYSRWFLYVVLAGVVVGNIIEADADIGGMAAAIGILLHVPQWSIVLGVTAAALTLQIGGSYGLIRNLFRVLAMTLLAYVVSAMLAHPDRDQLIRGTLMPSLHFGRDTLSILVAIIGTPLSAYLYTWQSNEEVEEKEAAGIFYAATHAAHSCHDEQTFRHGRACERLAYQHSGCHHYARYLLCFSVSGCKLVCALRCLRSGVRVYFLLVRIALRGGDDLKVSSQHQAVDADVGARRVGAVQVYQIGFVEDRV